jgi:hypothetical protein
MKALNNYDFVFAFIFVSPDDLGFLLGSHFHNSISTCQILSPELMRAAFQYVLNLGTSCLPKLGTFHHGAPEVCLVLARFFKTIKFNRL